MPVRIVTTKQNDDEKTVEAALRPQTLAEYVGQARMKDALSHAGDLAAILTTLQAGDILFIDEIHRLPAPVEEALYPAMEDFQLDLIIGQGPSTRTIKLDLPRFTLIGATTRVASLTSPLRERFGLNYRLDFYTPQELEAIILRSAGILRIPVEAS